MHRMFTALCLMSLSLPCLAEQPSYDPELLQSYFSNMRQLHIPLFAAMETFCQTNQWPSHERLSTVLSEGFNIAPARFRATTKLQNILAIQYQAWPMPEWFVTIKPHTYQGNHRAYFNLQLSTKNNQTELGVDGLAHCLPDHHLSDITLLLRDPNDPTPASLTRVVEQRDFAELGKTPHLNASYRG